tara:strand:+ start:624 stop:830 length:207 start_codon:yes stop_codon:yes gene_type:complete
MKKYVDGKLVDMTAKDIKARDVVKEESKKFIEQREKDKQDKLNNKTSGKSKLKDLGLNDKEIEALLGV